MTGLQAALNRALGPGVAEVRRTWGNGARVWLQDQAALIEVLGGRQRRRGPRVGDLDQALARVLGPGSWELADGFRVNHDQAQALALALVPGCTA